MARLARCEVFDPNEVNLVHCINRTVRRCFLLGDDAFSGKNFDHRKVWIETLLEHFAAHFGIDLVCYSILSNHYHLILRNRPDVVAQWEDTEVARRWLMICPPARCKGKPGKPTEAELNTIRNCPAKVAEIRKRLSDISWWMRLLNQRIAQRANREEGESGRFWQDRYVGRRLLDEAALVSCMAYVDLNPVRAGIADTPERSDHTSVQRRLEAHRSSRCNATKKRRDALLTRLTIDEATDPVGPHAANASGRCSDKGVLPITLEEYLELLHWTAQHVGKERSSTEPPVLKTLGIAQESWLQLVERFDEAFFLVAGRCDHIATARSNRTGRRFQVRPLAKALLPAAS